jgi:hypothetical protein
MISALATFHPGRIEITALPNHSDPRAHRAIFERLEHAARTGSSDWGFNLTVSYRQNRQKAKVGWLRTGYLFAFAALGYRYILRPALDPIRQQLRSPAETLVPPLVARVKVPIGGDGIAILRQPSELRSVLVRIGARYVFLPDFNDDESFYRRFADAHLDKSTNFEGLSFDLPRGPTLALDFSSGPVP